jgi:hypothetical protein
VRADRRPRLSLLDFSGSAGILPAVFGILLNTLQPLSRAVPPSSFGFYSNSSMTESCDDRSMTPFEFRRKGTQKNAQE